MAKTKLVRHYVCVDCYGVGILFSDCRCAYAKQYKMVELEFEECTCCGNFQDGEPADTEFNTKQIETLK